MDATQKGLQKILDQQGRTLLLKTAFSLDTCMSDGLEYVHSYEYTHPGVKPPSLLYVFSKNNESETYLIDSANFRVSTSQTKHKKSKEDLRKAHDGTTEFATLEDCTGAARPRRIAVGLLEYKLLKWLYCERPREGDLKNRIYATRKAH
ncbi:serine/threonine-protein kinase VRK1-like [Rhipicephalus microplus]|uniref:serine/threonine-protein kinase VRK1-like n=1 Tax=Rhipicephalus microplus TaxID=6941 RepID=UPI003F6AC7E8